MPAPLALPVLEPGHSLAVRQVRISPTQRRPLISAAVPGHRDKYLLQKGGWKQGARQHVGVRSSRNCPPVSTADQGQEAAAGDASVSCGWGRPPPKRSCAAASGSLSDTAPPLPHPSPPPSKPLMAGCSSGRWCQSRGLQHLHPLLSCPSCVPLHSFDSPEHHGASCTVAAEAFHNGKGGHWCFPWSGSPCSSSGVLQSLHQLHHY